MHEEKNLNTYMVRYRTIGSDNLLNMTTEKSEIKASSSAAAIEIFKKTKPGVIRIDKVEQTNKPLEVKIKKKKHIGAYIFAALFVCASLAKLTQRMLSNY